MSDLDDFPQFSADSAVLSAIAEVRTLASELFRCDKLSVVDDTTTRLHEAMEILKLALEQARKSRRVYGP